MAIKHKIFFLLTVLLIVSSFIIQLRICYAEDTPSQNSSNAENSLQSKDEDLQDLSGFLIGVKGLVGFTLLDFKNTLVRNAPVTPGDFASPVEGGGGVTLGVRFAISGLEAPIPVYIRFELEYSQRVPYNLNAVTSAFSVISHGIVNPILGFDKASVVEGFADKKFDLRVGSQQVTAAIFLDIDTRSAVVPYIGAIFGITIFDVQMKSDASFFTPTQEVVTPGPPPVVTIYGTINSLETRSTEASFLWGIAAGTQILVNDYIMFDLGARYLNNASFSVGTPGLMNIEVKYDYVEAYIGLSILL